MAECLDVYRITQVFGVAGEAARVVDIEGRSMATVLAEWSLGEDRQAKAGEAFGPQEATVRELVASLVVECGHA